MELSRHKQRGISYLIGGQGEPMLLLHGIPGSSLAWKKAGTHLADNYQVIIPDLRGFGQSDWPHGDYYMAAQAAALKDLLNGLGVTGFYLGGHDFGGPVAITLMRQFPEFQVKGLVLSATNVFTDTYVPPPLRLARVPGLSTIMFAAMAGNRAGLWLMYQAATKNKHEAGWNQFKRHLTPAGMKLTRLIFQRSLADLPGNYREVEAMLGWIDIPALVLWGDSDPFFAPAVGKRIQKAIPEANLTVYTSTGHFVPEERPQQVSADILTFFGEANKS